MHPAPSTRRSTSRRRWLAVAASLSLPATVLAGALPPASAAPPASSAGHDAVVFYQVRADGVAPTDLAQQLLAAGLDVEGRTRDGLMIMGDSTTGTALRAAGVEIVSSNRIDPVVTVGAGGGDQDAILPRRLHGRTYETYYGGYRTAEAYQQFEEDVAEVYPDFAQLVTYGESYTGDNPLRALCITANAADGCQLEPDVDKARFLLVTQIHARELTTSEISWRMITHLLDRYEPAPRVRALLDSTEVWIVPQINPDGVEVVQEGIEEEGLGVGSPAWQRKNLNPGPVECPGPWAYSHRGVDLNRNWDSHWGGEGTDPDPCGQTWPGDEGNSEPETYELADLMTQIFRDQRGEGQEEAAPLDATGGMLSLHTAANLVLFPWGYDSDFQAPNDEGLRAYAFRASYYNGYETGQPGEVLYNASGTTDDWSYDVLGIASGTWELGPGAGECGGFHPAYTCQDDFWKLNRPALKYQAVAARAPYMWSLGPTVTDARAVLVGDQVRVVGIANDAALGENGPNPPEAQDVTAARLYIGQAPWEGGTPLDMELTGSGTERKASIEVAAGDVETLGYIQAQDADGNWGAPRVVWIDAAE